MDFTPFGWLLVSTYTFIALVICGCVCLDTEEGPFATVLKYLTDDLPSFLARCFRAVLGDRLGGAIVNFLSSASEYAFNQRNPILQGFYLAVVLGAYGTVVINGYPRLPCYYLPLGHRFSAFTAVAFCLWIWWKACTVSPGLVTPETLHRYDHNYPFDNWLYLEGRPRCRTSGILRPPRSKFCRFMGANVARYDHFCPWLNNAVGQENYAWFLGFLLAHCLLLAYGAAGMLALLASEAQDKQLLEASFYNARLGRPVKANWRIVMQYLIFQNWMIFGVGVLCAVMAIVLFGFFSYHMYLASFNITTNESYKWSELKRSFKKAKALQEQTRKERESRLKRWGGEVDGDGEDLAGGGASGQQQGSWEANGLANGVSEDNGHCGGNSNGNGGRNGAVTTKGVRRGQNHGRSALEEEEETKEPRRKLPDKFPSNMYNHGIIANLVEVLHPLSSRAGGNPYLSNMYTEDPSKHSSSASRPFLSSSSLSSSSSSSSSSSLSYSSKGGKDGKGKRGNKGGNSRVAHAQGTAQQFPTAADRAGAPAPLSSCPSSTSPSSCRRGEDNLSFPLVGQNAAPVVSNEGGSSPRGSKNKARRRCGGENAKAE
jgi:hypothetical protein